MGLVTKFATACVILFAVWTQLRLYPHLERCVPCLEPQHLWGHQVDDTPDLTNQVAIVTGANVGLGLSTAKHLLQRGATVVMGCRRMGSCTAARDSLNGVVPDISRAVPLHIDLSSLKSVSAFADDVLNSFDHVDMVVLNAAVFPVEFGTATETELELAFSVNHVGHALLTNRLLQHYGLGSTMKISVVCSNHHYLAYETPQWTIAGALQNKSMFSANQAYGQSKLANIYFTQELTRRLDIRGADAIYVNAAHPGVRLFVCFCVCVLSLIHI